MQEIHNTQFFKVQKEQEYLVSDVIAAVYASLKEKGYNPVNQIVGYIMSEIGRASCRERVLDRV